MTRLSPAARKQDNLRRPYIGNPVRVLPGSGKGPAPWSGVVLDETKSTFLIQTEVGPKRVPKKGIRFAFPFGIVDGNDIRHAPSERLKRK